MIGYHYSPFANYDSIKTYGLLVPTDETPDSDHADGLFRRPSQPAYLTWPNAKHGVGIVRGIPDQTRERTRRTRFHRVAHALGLGDFVEYL